MNRGDGAIAPWSGRLRWAGYGFVAGVVVGVSMGWVVTAFIGAIFRLTLVAMVVVPLILLYLAWRKFVAPLLQAPAKQQILEPPAAIETTAVVRGSVREPLPR
jgi:apolipoprotein N-acyltransferase